MTYACSEKSCGKNVIVSFWTQLYLYNIAEIAFVVKERLTLYCLAEQVSAEHPALLFPFFSLMKAGI